MAWWLALESTTHGTGRPFDRNSLDRISSSPCFPTDSKRTHDGGPGFSMCDKPLGRGSNTRR
eukprot:13295055-Alexandrium_andersonii.AAC.1